MGLALLLGLALAGLGSRLIFLQALRHDDLSAKAQANTQREFLRVPRRGDIVDVRGTVLATSVTVKNICADPVLLGNPLIGNHQAEVAHALAPLLGESETALLQRLLPRQYVDAKGQTRTNQFTVLKRLVPIETWQKIQEAMLNLPMVTNELPATVKDRKSARARLEQQMQQVREKAIFARNDDLRIYPNQRLAAHALGYARSEEREIDGMPYSEIMGQYGVELSFDSKLKGICGWRVTETDSRKREQVMWRDQDVEPRDGLNVVLSIDSYIQNIVETAIAKAKETYSPVSVSSVVMRPATGEILAMATLPNFDPNSPGAFPAEALRNRVISDVAEPGSTFKIVVISGALNEGVVSPTELFDCENGHFYYANTLLHDSSRHGILDVEHIIAKSSNIGAAKVGIKLGEVRMDDYIRRYGFGSRTGIPLAGEVPGLVRPLPKWYKVSIAQIPMGQGIAVTPLQMIMAMGTIANHGMMMRPMLIERLEDSDHRVVARYSPIEAGRVISEKTANQMIAALKIAVSPEGTAAKAALEHYTVAGKTGTAQESDGHHYLNRFFSSFIGFFPAENPQVCISVVMDDPKGAHLGGSVAAPVFKEIAEQAAAYLGIRPSDASGDLPSPDAPPPSLASRGLKTASVRTP